MSLNCPGEAFPISRSCGSLHTIVPDPLGDDNSAKFLVQCGSPHTIVPDPLGDGNRAKILIQGIIIDGGEQPVSDLHEL